MAQNKPDKPEITLPDDFGGLQQAFSDELVESGYEPSVPQIIEGKNLNWFLNAFFQNIKYVRTVLDYVRDTPIGKMFWINSNGQMDYIEPAIIATDGEYTTGTSTTKTPNVKQVVDNFTSQQTQIDGLFYIGDVKTSLKTANHGDWFLCDGQELSRSTYSDLYALIGTTYGAGDGSTTFNLPDFTDIIQPTSSSVAIAGNGMTLGFTDGTNNYGLQVVAGDINTGMSAQKYGSDVGESWVNNPASAYKTVGITTDSTKSGIVGSIQNVQLNYFIKAK